MSLLGKYIYCLCFFEPSKTHKVGDIFLNHSTSYPIHNDAFEIYISSRKEMLSLLSPLLHFSYQIVFEYFSKIYHSNIEIPYPHNLIHTFSSLFDTNLQLLNHEGLLSGWKISKVMITLRKFCAVRLIKFFLVMEVLNCISIMVSNWMGIKWSIR